jgi:hypothetical protein
VTAVTVLVFGNHEASTVETTFKRVQTLSSVVSTTILELRLLLAIMMEISDYRKESHSIMIYQDRVERIWRVSSAGGDSCCCFCSV